MEAPTSDECNADAIIKESNDRLVFATWHPQWGGYVGRCIVRFDMTTNSSDDNPGCFEVWNWHDGDFPKDDYVDQKHYCSPEQLIDFGLKILEKMAKYQRARDGGRLSFDFSEYIERMTALETKHPHSDDK